MVQSKLGEDSRRKIAPRMAPWWHVKLPRCGKPRTSVREALNALALECAALPDFDTRSPDEIIGYDENGMW